MFIRSLYSVFYFLWASFCFVFYFLLASFFVLFVYYMLFFKYRDIFVPDFKPVEVFQDCSNCPKMVKIPSGEFMMGLPDYAKSIFKLEIPAHKVVIDKPFAVGIHEVTFSQYDSFIKETGYNFGKTCSGYAKDGVRLIEISNWSYLNLNYEQKPDFPVVCVSWNDAKAYVKWLSDKTGKAYRLLSEAEWEYVTRANTDTRFWWGNWITIRLANYNGIQGISYFFSYGLSLPKLPTSVGSYKANPFGIYDVVGNVSEMVEDCWHPDYNGAPKDASPWIKGGDCSKRVVRGSAWHKMYKLTGLEKNDYGSGYWERDGASVDRGYNTMGFRVARTLNEEQK